jgi:cytochrome c
MAASDCRACHQVERSLVGPSFMAIAARYHSDPKAPETLAAKIIQGGAGNWGAIPMPAHPQLDPLDAREIVRHVLSLAEAPAPELNLPAEGSFSFDRHRDTDAQPEYVLRARYTDAGAHGIGPLRGTAELRLRPARLRAAFADEHVGFERYRNDLGVGGNKAYLVFRDLDLTGLRSLSLEYDAEQSGTLQVRLDSFAGEVLAEAPFAPGEGKNPARSLAAPFSRAVPGRHSLYLVFIKAQTPNERLITPRTVEFND